MLIPRAGIWHWPTVACSTMAQKGTGAVGYVFLCCVQFPMCTIRLVLLRRLSLRGRGRNIQSVQLGLARTSESAVHFFLGERWASCLMNTVTWCLRHCHGFDVGACLFYQVIEEIFIYSLLLFICSDARSFQLREHPNLLTVCDEVFTDLAYIPAPLRVCYHQPVVQRL